MELGDFGKLHAPFFTERRTRCRVQCRVAGNPGTLGMTKGRAALTLATITAGSKSRRLSTIFITLDGPQDILTGAQPVRSAALLNQLLQATSTVIRTSIFTELGLVLVGLSGDRVGCPTGPSARLPEKSYFR